MTSNKIILLGDSGVGKTTILNNFLDINQQPEVTIGVQHHSFTRNNVKFSIWDTAGQEKYRSVVSSHYKRAKAAILVYDCSNEQSILHIDKWIEELVFQVGNNVIMALIGNKTDLQKIDMNEHVQNLQEKYEIAYHTQTNHNDPEFKDKINLLMDQIGKSIILFYFLCLGLYTTSQLNSQQKPLIFTIKQEDVQPFQTPLVQMNGEENLYLSKKNDNPVEVQAGQEEQRQNCEC